MQTKNLPESEASVHGEHGKAPSSQRTDSGTNQRTFRLLSIEASSFCPELHNCCVRVTLTIPCSLFSQWELLLQFSALPPTLNMKFICGVRLPVQGESHSCSMSGWPIPKKSFRGWTWSWTVPLGKEQGMFYVWEEWIFGDQKQRLTKRISFFSSVSSQTTDLPLGVARWLDSAQ